MSLSAIAAARPETAIVLGSGLGEVAEALGVEAQVPYAEIPGLGAATVPGHAGRLVLARVNGRPVLIAQGRRHLYEGLTAHEVTAGIRLMHELGVRRVLLTNAAGAISEHFQVGGLMLITDHLNLQGTTPLLGGPHFHDMSQVYDADWRAVLLAAAQELGQTLHQGVYAALLGPQYETPAEIRMLRVLGADAVGMSTVPEAIQARALGMQVAGISMLTNWAAGLKPQTLDHAEVIAVGRAASQDLAALLRAAL
jgi:purine-nucleoside phosphorylase